MPHHTFRRKAARGWLGHARARASHGVRKRARLHVSVHRVGVPTQSASAFSPSCRFVGLAHLCRRATTTSVFQHQVAAYERLLRPRLDEQAIAF